MTDLEPLPQRVPARIAFADALPLWEEAECHSPEMLQRCLDGLRALPTDPPPADPLPPSTGAQAAVDQIIARWRATHD